MHPVVIEHLGRGHPLDRHIGDFLTYRSNAAASRQAIRAYRGSPAISCARSSSRALPAAGCWKAG